MDDIEIAGAWDFEEALRWKMDIERDVRFRIVALREMFYRRGCWYLAVTFQHQKDGKRRYTRLSVHVHNAEEWAKFRNRCFDYVTAQNLRYHVIG